MLKSPDAPSRQLADDFLSGGGEMGERIRAHDWTTSPLGPPQGWPQSLRTAVSLMLNSLYPMFIAWGPQLAFLYNDAYRPIFGAKHPHTLGRPFAEVWSDIWDDISPLVTRALEGEATFNENLHLVMDRNGYAEDTWYTFSYSPVRDESGGVGGMFCACQETTGQVLAERRVAAERERFKRTFERAPGFIAILNGPEHVFEFANDAYAHVTGRSDFVGKTVREVFDDLEGQGIFELLDRVYRTGERFVANKISLRLQPDPERPPEDVVLDFIYAPIMDDSGEVTGIFVEGHDVTAAHQAEQLLREGETRFRNMSDNAPVMMWVTDATGYCNYLNARWYEFTGQEKGAAEGFGWLDAIHPDDRAGADAALRSATAAQTDFRIEYRLRRRDGAYRWTIDAASPRFGEDGGFLGFVGSVIDIDDRLRAEEALRASEARFEAIANSINQMVWSTQPDGYHDFYNQRWYEFTGVPEGSTDGEGWNDLFHPDDQARAWAVWGHSLETGEPYHIEYRLRHRSGEYRWVLGRANPVLDADGRIARWFGTCTDIQEIIEAREVLARSREELEAEVAERTRERDRAWRMSRDILAITTLEGVFRAVNPAWTAVLGHDPAEVVGRSYREFIWPEDLARTEAIRRGAEAGEELTAFENRYRHKDGTPRWLSWNTSPDGDMIYAYGRDVTEEKARQAALAAAQEALRQSQKLEAMGQLTGGVAHDFNNLLTPIIGSLDMLLRRGIGGPREQRLIDGALQSAERAKTLVQRLLAFARRQPLQAHAVDVAALVDGMADLVSSTSGPQVRVVVDAPDDLPPAWADANQLEMAILNLSVNARDAMPDGGTLSIAAAEETVGAGHRAKLTPGRYIRLSVADSGAGMTPETVRRAIEPFFSTKGVGKGTGLGLSMVHGLASQLGGGMTLTSRVGLGTNVELWLPVSDIPAQPEAPARDAPPAGDGMGTVLLVDDEDLVRMSTADMLAQLGYNVVEAVSAEMALRALEEGLHMDVLVTDHLMPGMTGVDLARAVLERRPQTSVLVISGFAEAEGLAVDLPRLTKPFRQADLAASLAECRAPPARGPDMRSQGT